ncbi:MAG: 2-hydroxyacyl-CoA dehydratase [Phycisphaeraceae bacterium]|nr:2-hydroxyacyl-CoA dehydratase [Phycisphaeraceae bacterium]
MPCVGYNSAYVPPEWIAAHQLQPWRPTLRISDAATREGVSQDGCCSCARAFVAEVSSRRDVVGIVVAAVCDQIRRVSEWLIDPSSPPVLLFHVPATWQTSAARQCYRDELLRLGRFLEQIGGQSPTPQQLRHNMMDYDRERQAMRAMFDDLRGRPHADAVAKLHGDMTEDDSPAAPDHATDESASHTPIALLGSTVPRYQWWLYDAIEQHGGRVVLDATDYGERGLPRPFDAQLLADDPLEALAAAYLAMPHVRQRPNDGLFHWLHERMAHRHVRGLILRRNLWCDLWHAEVARIKASACVPVLDLDLDVDASAPQRALGRIAAFMEMLH